MQKNDQVNTFT